MKVRQPPRSLNLPPQDKVERGFCITYIRGRPIEPRHFYGPIADDSSSPPNSALRRAPKATWIGQSPFSRFQTST
jgi:hypothetical protein